MRWTKTRLLEQATRHTWDDRAYLGWALRRWSLCLGWTWDQVACDLGVQLEELHHMMLHQRPNPWSHRYAVDLQSICQRYDVSYHQLAEICRFAAAALY